MRYGGHTPCIVVRLHAHAPVVLDAGTGIRALGHALTAQLHAERPPGPSTNLSRPELLLLLSHRHNDHLMGLPHFTPLMTRSHRVRIACWGVDTASLTSLVMQQLSAPLIPTLSGVREAVHTAEFDDQDALSLGDGAQVLALPAHHPGGAAVMRIDDADGPVLAYAPDNELALGSTDGTLAVWRRALTSALSGTPLLLHDATYTDDELPAHRGWGHSSAEEATRFAIECRIGTLALIHHHPDRSDDAVDALLARCQSIVAASGSPLTVVAARDGMTLQV